MQKVQRLVLIFAAIYLAAQPASEIMILVGEKNKSVTAGKQDVCQGLEVHEYANMSENQNNAQLLITNLIDYAF